jgi:hypothetical protein
MSHKILKDQHSTTKDILPGLKGRTFLETGYVYAPYVPLNMTPLFAVNPLYKKLKRAGLKTLPRTPFTQEDFKPKKGIMTRYGCKLVKSNFYDVLEVEKE